MRVADKLRLPDFPKLFQRMMGWILKSAGMEDTVGHQLLKGVPRHARNPMYCLGGITLVAFVIQAMSGVFLATYYVPSVDHAWDSIRYIEQNVAFGYIIRNIHRWTANIMVVALVLHTLRVYFTRAFRSPRELTWMIGVMLFFLTVGVAFTGYTLPWDQRAYWAATVGTNLITALSGTPFIGSRLDPLTVFLREIFIGGGEIGPSTLTRFYGFHILVFPGSIMLFMLIHFYLVRKHGIAGPL
ncbi:MAG: cytochrome b N-terminal domain-containing protein [Thermoplasmata archaeon]